MGKIDHLIGLAQKAGMVRSGEFSVEKSVKGGLSCLVLLADDASENTKKKFSNMCSFYHVPIEFYSSKEQMGAAIGRDLRSVVSVEDDGFANAMIKKLRQV